MASSQGTGGVSLEEIEEFMSAEPLPPSLAGASIQTRFVRKIADLVSARAGLGEKGEFSVFLLSEALHDDTAGHDCEEVPLVANGQDVISNQVWIATARFGTAFRCKLPWADQSTLYAAIRSAGLGHLPALVVDWRSATPIGTIYAGGLNRSDDNSKVVFESSPISASSLRAVLDRFWAKCLRTPGLSVEGHAMKVWETASKGIPAERPEERIQGKLLDAIKTHFTRHEMRAEPYTDDGRIDILIWSSTVSMAGMPVQLNEWVLELKAITDRTSTDQPKPPSRVNPELQGGLEQAMAYRGRTKALHAALCCYDMRAKDVGDVATFSTIAAEASRNDVALWRWYMFRTTSAARHAALATA